VLKQSAPAYLIVKKNDLDKLVRSTLDALSGIAFIDDCQVTNLSASKRYCNEDEVVGADILINEL
jgi:crossover junction endodeoxyribonuclease RusA